MKPLMPVPVFNRIALALITILCLAGVSRTKEGRRALHLLKTALKQQMPAVAHAMSPVPTPSEKGTSGTAAVTGDAEAVRVCHAHWDALADEIALRPDTMSGDGSPTFHLKNVSQVLTIVTALRDDKQCMKLLRFERNPDDWGPLDSCAPNFVETWRKDPMALLDAPSTPERPLPQPMPGSPRTRFPVWEWTTCLDELVLYHLRARVAVMGERDPAELDKTEDVLAALLMKVFYEGTGQPMELVRYARRLVEIDPESPTARQMLMKTTFARFAIETDSGEKKRAEAEFIEAMRTGSASGRLTAADSAMTAAYIRLIDPSPRAFRIIGSLQDMLMREERVYHIAWGRYRAGDVEMAKEDLKVIAGDVGEYGNLAREALHRLQNGSSHEPFLDPSVMIGFRGTYDLPPSVDPRVVHSLFGASTDFGPLRNGGEQPDVPREVQDIQNGISMPALISPEDWQARNEKLDAILMREGLPLLPF